MGQVHRTLGALGLLGMLVKLLRGEETSPQGVWLDLENPHQVKHDTDGMLMGDSHMTGYCVINLGPPSSVVTSLDQYSTLCRSSFKRDQASFPKLGSLHDRR